MAWRIDESVIRGEIDNRTRDRVIGKIWFVGRAEPVTLDLRGNAHRDLAGRKLEFRNPTPKGELLSGFAELQAGVIGDFTASRKARVPDVSEEEFKRLYVLKQPIPWHWANTLYLEWFSARNGRVVIETSEFELTIVPEIAWEMTVEEESEQLVQNRNALQEFMERLADVVEKARKGEGKSD